MTARAWLAANYSIPARAVAVIGVLASAWGMVIAVGDTTFKKKSKKVFDERREHATLLLVSHSSSLLRAFCHIGGVMKDGKITFYDDIEDAIAVHEDNLARGK